MTTKSIETVKLGSHSEAVEEKNRRRAIDRLAELGFKKKLVLAAFDGDFESAKELSSSLSKKKEKMSPALLKYSAGALMAAFYNKRKRMPLALVRLIFKALGVEKFNRRETKSLDEQEALVCFAIAFPNASLTTAGKYIGWVNGRPKLHVETVKNWYRNRGLERVLERIANDEYQTFAKTIRSECKDSDFSSRLLKRNKKLRKTGIYGFLLNDRKNRSV